MKFFTIGYGGRKPSEFLDLLSEHEVQAIADVRIRPDRSAMGAYSRARTPEKGIARLLGERGISYHSLIELGNPFLEYPDWRPPYHELLERAGNLLTARLDQLPQPFCLLCAEKHVADCHRRMIADYLVKTRGWSAEHIE